MARTAPSQHLTILRQDLRHAWRGLRRTPVVTATAILTLALGVGASTAVFSVVHAVLLRPLPYSEADRLVELFEDNPAAGFPLFRVSALNYLSWAERSGSFEAIGAFQSTNVTLTEDRDPEMLTGSHVTASLFRVLRVHPIVGRTLQPEDEQRGSSRVVVVSEPLWRSRFSGDPRIVGRLITLDGERHQVVGVMPRAFRGVGRTQASATAEAQIFLPMVIDRTRENRGNHTLRVIGRLRPEVPLDQARNEMGAVSAALAREFPASNRNWGVRIETLPDAMRDPQVHRSLLLVFGAVTMVLLIACANVANLMLARGARRDSELALRAALGAGRSRLIRQLLTESGCVAAISGAAGVLTAAVAHPVVRALVPPTLPRLDEMRVDVSVLAFGLLISIVSGAVFGVIPALRASRVDLAQALTLAGRSAVSPRGRLRQVLIGGQLALATMLLVGAVLQLQGLVRLQRVPLGFEPDGVLTTRISLPRSSYPDVERVGRFFEQLLHTLNGSGQLRSVAVATSAPFAPGVRASFRPAQREQAPGAGVGGGNAVEHIVSGDYFRVLGIPLLAGRAFNQQDGPGTAAVAIVSQGLARMVWADTNPVGQFVERSGRPYEVVGVVGDIRGSDGQGGRGGGPDREPRAAVYFAAAQLPQRTMTLLVRPDGEPTSVVGMVRDAVRQQDTLLALQQVRPLKDWFAESVAPARLTTTLATIFAVIALLLASVGIYGVLAFMVASRTREIGVRMAIGATRQRIMALVLRDGMTWAVGGILVGLIGAYAAARFIARILFETPARDPVTFAAAGGAVAFVALIACAIPAARAVRIDPALAMRTE